MKTYEEKYKKALEWMREVYPTLQGAAKEDAEYVFPELKESEGEGIRKALLEMVHDTTGDSLWVDYNVHKEDAIAWLEKQGKNNIGISEATKKKLEDNLNNALEKETPESWNEFLEKQGEQNHADKVEPKFKDGDWVVNKLGDLWHIDSSDKKNYQVSDGKGNYNYFPISKQEEMRLWTIQDAKDGDVLASKDGNDILIFRNIEDNVSFSSYYNIARKGEHYWLKSSFIPATKEQCDTLFTKMKEAGYEWNTEKKELKKVEQEQVIDYPDNHPKDNWELIQEFVNKFGRIPKDEDELNVLVEYVLKRQKPAEWSEKDEAIYYGVIETEQYMLDVVNGIKKFSVGSISIKEECARELNWLKSLKDRVQPKQEWSKEDEKMLDKMRDYFMRFLGDKPDFTDDKRYEGFVEFIDHRLKSLRPNYWKPSKEQLNALHWCVMNVGSTEHQVLQELLEQLEKLKD